MSLQEWLSNGWLTQHRTSPAEIADLVGLIRRDLADARTAGLSPDWRLNIAYNAALQAAVAALAAAGYRATREAHHFRVIQSLLYTMQTDDSVVRQLDQFRKKRNLGGYERAGAVSDLEAAEMLKLAQQLDDELATWLDKQHPELL